MSRKAVQRLAVAAATAIALVTGVSALVVPPGTGWQGPRPADDTQAQAFDTGWQRSTGSGTTNDTGWQ